MHDPTIILVDNGSRRPGATLSLRRIAADLSAAVGHPVFPVSLQHSDRIPAGDLGGRPADLFTPFLRRQIQRGQRSFIVLPLFFGPSRALSAFIPEQVAALTDELGSFRLRQARVLCPLPAGEDRLADILADNVLRADADAERVVVVDHGSPVPQVTAVREWLAAALRARLPDSVEIDQAVMERREGRDYDFNGALLSERLDGVTGRVVLGMVFLSPGRHAGPGGDIAEICADAESRNPGLRVTPSALIGDHPGLIEILQDRLKVVRAELSGDAGWRRGAQ